MANNKEANIVTREERIAEMRDLANSISDYNELDYFMKVLERAVRHGVFEPDSDVRTLEDFLRGVRGIFGDIGDYVEEGHDVELTWSLIARSMLNAFYESKRSLHETYIP